MRALCVFLAAAVVVLVSGCVAAPTDIQPTYVDGSKYAGMTCDQLKGRKAETEVALAALSKKQSSARARSIAYNILLVAGSGALAKDRADQIGVVKGELLAIEDALLTCKS